MHVLIPVFFKAAHGGLHENVLASARHLIANGHQATVVCPQGPFSDSLAGYGIGVIRTDFANHSPALEATFKLHSSRPIDLVHAHPFASRKFGLIVSEQLDLPFVLTLHGKYTDGIADYIEKVSAILPVSPGIQQFVLNEGVGAPEKFHVIPNVPDTALFRPIPKNSQIDLEGKLRVSLISRLDKDKQFILDVFADAVQYAAKQYAGKIAWVVAGDGSQADGFRSRLDAIRGQNTVEFRGWLEGAALHEAYCASAFVFAPGRCALEAMSCGVPTISVGSKAYCGLIQPETWQHAVFTNFGGVGNRHEDYRLELVSQDLDKLMGSANIREGLGFFGRQVIEQFFNAPMVHEKLLGIYRLAIASHALCKAFSPNSFSSKAPVSSNQKKAEAMPVSSETYQELIEQIEKQCSGLKSKLTKDLLIVQNRLYAQLESLSWLQRRLKIKGQLPPLRGWAASPDVLLTLHTHIMSTRPRVIVEFGSGASTLVIADALRQNGLGKLISIEHSEHYGAQTLRTLQAEQLQEWVDLRVGELEPWDGEHLNPKDADKPSRWYPLRLLDDIREVDLLWADGPPGTTCLYSRYPALPALATRLSPGAEVWLDDTIRKEEVDICKAWAAKYGFEVEFLPLEKGLGRLTRVSIAASSAKERSDASNAFESGFDFEGSDEKIG